MSYIDLAADALRANWTRQRVIVMLKARILRDQRYLAYRRNKGTFSAFDEMTESDLHALALAVCWLTEDTTNDQDSERPPLVGGERSESDH